MTFNIFNTVKKELKKNNLLKGYSDEGGFWPSNLNYIEICEYINNAIKKNNYEIGEDVAISIDVAANELYSDKKYIIHNKEYSVDNLIKTYERLNQDYNVKLIEDPFFEKDFDSFKKLKKNLIDKSCEIIGDDLTCTNIDLLKNAVNLNSIDGIIIKLNQCGTITETINVIKFCKKNNIKTILSARSGDTEENYLSHLAVGWNTDMIKVGSFSRSERTSKWNELIRIQEQLN
jgi:enolase